VEQRQITAGLKWYIQKYRLHGKEKTFALGVFPTVSLADARKDALAAKRLVSKNIDPTVHRKQEKMRQTDNRFRVIAAEWHKKEVGRWTTDHAANVLRTLKTDAFPLIGDIPVDQVTAQDALRVIRCIEARGALDVAGRVNQRMSAVFRFAMRTGRATSNPCDALKGVIETRRVTHRKSVSIDVLPDFLKALESYPGYGITKLALKLLILTFVRPGELRGAQWNEFDLEGKEWRIPAERMKMKQEHIVPLADQAVAVLEEVQVISGGYDLVFPGAHNWRKPMSENTMNFGIQKRLKYDATAHGFRTVASTVLNETGFRIDVIERQLAHAERNKVRAAYNKAQHLTERREMMQWWANYIDSLGKEGKSGNK
jgi:integrase